MASRLSNPESALRESKRVPSCCVDGVFCACPPGRAGSVAPFKLSVSLLVLCSVCLSVTEREGGMSLLLFLSCLFLSWILPIWGPCH